MPGRRENTRLDLSSKHIYKLCLKTISSIVDSHHSQALDGDQLNLGVAIFMLGSALVPLFAGGLAFLKTPILPSHKS